MSNSVGSAIEKIKLLEQDNDAKLKERRENDAAVSFLQRSIRETLQQVEKSEQEQLQLEKKVDSLRSELEVARTRRDALVAQVKACTEELEKFRATCEQNIKNVWEIRSSLCTAVHETADDCDIRALLLRPIRPELPPLNKKKNIVNDDNQISLHEARLKTAIERKEKAVCERDRLMAEPEMGEEFVRIKNALQYSFEMISNLKNSK